ncbi:MAG: recombinase family protein, partial [Actinobacteria bacterium]|nr:recombinase family protein [Actinomycetota bacterium]
AGEPEGQGGDGSEIGENVRDAKGTTTAPFRAAIYLRVSSQGQVKTDYDPQGNSIPSQRAACIQRAKEIGAVIVDEYVEPGRSAKELEKRAAFQDMRRRIKTKKDVDYVIVYAFNRAFRNAADRAVVSKEFRKAGARIIATNLVLEDTPESEMIEGIMSYVDEYRIKADGKDIAYKMGEKIKRGGTVTVAKLGYKNVRVDIDGRKVADIALDEERAPFILQMFELYATGRYGYYDLQEIMTERGLRTRPTARFPKPGPISIHSIGRILRDHYYCGWVTHEGIEHKGRHPAIVHEALFQRVQHVLDAERGGGTRNRVHKHPLKGRVWCDRCGKRLLIAKANGNGGTYYYFFCTGRQNKSCTLPYLPVAEKSGVEAAVTQHYKDVRLDADFRAEVSAMTEAALTDELDTNEQLRRELSTRLTRLDAKETALVSYIGDPDWPREKLSAQMQEVRREQEGVRRQLGDIQAALSAGREVLLRGMKLLTTPDRIYDEGSDVVRAVLTKAIFTRLYLDADEERRVSVAAHELAEPFDALVPAQTAWRHTAASEQATTGTAGRGMPTAGLGSIRGRYSLMGAPASDDQDVVRLLAAIFERSWF